MITTPCHSQGELIILAVSGSDVHQHNITISVDLDESISETEETNNEQPVASTSLTSAPELLPTESINNVQLATEI